MSMNYRIVKKALGHAGELIAKPGGWIQGTLKNGAGAYCAMGAMNEVAQQAFEAYGDLGMTQVLYNEMEWVFRKANCNVLIDDEGRSQPIPRWNDSPFRRKVDVVMAFQRAVSYLEAKIAEQDNEAARQAVKKVLLAAAVVPIAPEAQDNETIGEMK